MTKSALLASTAVALCLCAAQATAQVQQKEEKQQTPQTRTEPKGGGQDKQAPAEKVEKQQPDRSAQDKSDQGKNPKAVEKKQETPAKQKSAEPSDKGQPGKQQSSEKSESQKKSDKAEMPRKDKAASERKEPTDKSQAQKKDLQTKEKAAAGERKDGTGTGQRTQLSEQQRTNVHQTITKERSVNRATNVNFTINIGTRVPRSVRLAPLPVAVISVVPAYRSYRYVVVHDDIIIVDPASYEIVEVIKATDDVAYKGGGSGGGRLVLTEEERRIVLSEVDMRGGSTLGLGALTEGADVPRDVSLMTFPVTVVERVPRLRDYRYFTAESRVAIVDPSGRTVQLVIEDRR